MNGVGVIDGVGGPGNVVLRCHRARTARPMVGMGVGERLCVAAEVGLVGSSLL